jgi:hypothetical protein
MFKRFLFIAAASASLHAQQHPTGTRITPPTVASVSPRGIARGTTVELTVEGFNLAKASAIYFNKPGIKGRVLRVKELPDAMDVRLGSNGTLSTVDLGPLPPRNQVTVELDVAGDAEVGEVGFRVQTPLGTSPEGTFLIEPYYGESPDREPNDTPETAFETYLPSILVGAITKPGDLDHYKIHVKAGEELVFDNSGGQLGSTLIPIITILDAGGATVRTSLVTPFAHKFAQAGTYYIRIADYQESGRASHTYRMKVGDFPVATGAFPLGLEKGKSAQIELYGYHLASSKVEVKGRASTEQEDALMLRPEDAFNDVKLAVGDEPEVLAAGKGQQAVPFPVTINGRVAEKSAQEFRFKLRKGRSIIAEVKAQRLGSKLDSVIEILDAKGKPIERAVVQPVWETSLVLRDHESTGPGLRISNWNGLAVGDDVMTGSEVGRVEALPRGPDDDMRVESFGGQRTTLLDTTAEAHAVDQAFYKVKILPAGSKPAPNGLPIARIHYRNDDGGPGYGRDSLLHFTAPYEGEFIVRIGDVRGQGGNDYAYRLTLRDPKPDFRLTVNPKNPNVPRGGTIPLTVTAFRMDGYEGPIEVTLENLPDGLRASKAEIGAGQVSATVLVSADESARLAIAAPLTVKGTAGNIAHYANPDDKLKLISLMPQPDVAIVATTREVTLEPGGTAEISVKVKRQNGFSGRVPVQVMNLPPRVRVLDVGLNGVLLNETDTERTFVIEALPSAEAIEQYVYVSGAVETRSNLQNSYAANEPILVKVRPKTTRLAAQK